MSIPTFPEVDPEMTREHALTMILSSIAIEELALSHVINAEGEKLQYVLCNLEAGCNKDNDIDKLLCVNDSITNLLEMVSQNQILLKNKMDKVLQALPCEYPCPPVPIVPPGPTCKCSAVFKGSYKCEIWQSGCAIPWNTGNIQGQCVQRDSYNHEKILICSKGRYMINFIANVRAKSCCPCDVAISLQMCNSQHCLDVFTCKDYIPCDGMNITTSISGIIIDTSNFIGKSYLKISLLSPTQLMVEDAVLNVTEI